MKKVLFFLSMSFIFFSFQNMAMARVGEPCCPEELAGIRWIYNISTNQCENTVGTQRAISCEIQEEKCNPGPPEMRGTCILKDITAPTPIGISCGNLDQQCCPGESQISSRTCTSPNTPSDPFSKTCICTRTLSWGGLINCSVDGKTGINTAIGCIPTEDTNVFVGWILGRFIFVASGIAFLLMVVGTFQILTSAGTPEKVKAGKELITSALSGLVFIILSMFILKLIGVDILQIPEFGN